MTKHILTNRIAKALDLIGEQGNPQDSAGLPVRNPPSPFSAFLPFLCARKQRRLNRLLEPGNEIGAVDQLIDIGADERWTSSNITLVAGEAVEISLNGRLFLSKSLEVSIAPQSCIWYRFGQGNIRRLSKTRQIIVATEEGELMLQAALPGAFGSPAGDINQESPPPKMTGKVTVGITRVDTPKDLTQETPTGWHYLWRIGQADIFKRCDSDNVICCSTHGDVGILQYPVEKALDENLSLDWQWLMESLPSRLPEHIQPTHDYLSIAVEFDNGLDLTYMWSSELPPDTIFQCPLPWWDKRETHWVLRTPADGLTIWHTESRSLLSDYKRAIGGKVPEKVVAVWLIANSAFQNGHGICRYRDIRIGDAAIPV